MHAAAGGGVGLLLVQWLKHMGAIVVGTVSTEEKAKIAREAGANYIIFYTKQDFMEEAKKITGGKGVDYIIDGVGKSTFAKIKQAYAGIASQVRGLAEKLEPTPLRRAVKRKKVTRRKAVVAKKKPERRRSRVKPIERMVEQTETTVF